MHLYITLCLILHVMAQLRSMPACPLLGQSHTEPTKYVWDESESLTKVSILDYRLKDDSHTPRLVLGCRRFIPKVSQSENLVFPYRVGDRLCNWEMPPYAIVRNLLCIDGSTDEPLKFDLEGAQAELQQYFETHQQALQQLMLGASDDTLFVLCLNEANRLGCLHASTSLLSAVKLRTLASCGFVVSPTTPIVPSMLASSPIHDGQMPMPPFMDVQVRQMINAVIRIHSQKVCKGLKKSLLDGLKSAHWLEAMLIIALLLSALECHHSSQSDYAASHEGTVRTLSTLISMQSLTAN